TVITATGGTAIGSTQATGNEYTKAFDGTTTGSGGWASSSGNVTNQWVGYHHFWRLFCTDNNGGSTYIEIDEVEFRATSGGSDQVPAMSSNNGAGSGSSAARPVGSSQLGAGNEIYRAFDNTTAPFNAWASSGTTNQYVGALLATPIAVQEILVRAGADTTNAPKNMTLDYSDDGVTWTTQKTF